MEIIAATHAGMTTEEFEDDRDDWIATARHPRLQAAVHRAGLSADAGAARLPARERLQDVHRVRRRRRVHAALDGDGLRHSARAGRRQPHQGQVRDRATASRCWCGSPRSISSTTRPASRSASTRSSAVGRSRRSATRTAISRCSQWTTPAKGPRFGLIVHHTDAEREWAYDRKSHIGQLARGLDEAPKRSWIVVDMKQDWKVIYPFQK